MRSVINFSSGPALLPEPVLRQVAEELLDWRASGMSVMEMSHRGKHYMTIHEQAQSDLRELMRIPSDYSILFLSGGASLQFSMIPMNFLEGGRRADYITTGEWSRKAFGEALRYGDAAEAASSQSTGFLGIPDRNSWRLRPEATYVHFCSNETIGGVEFQTTPDIGEAALVADMSSNILSRPIDVSRYALIYAGAQKNIGPSGLTIIIIRNEFMAQAASNMPALLHYQAQALADSMINTPATFSVYVSGLVFQWLKKQGGPAAMESRNIAKARLLYDTIDASSLYVNRVEATSRSRMNIPFQLRRPELDEAFLKGAEAAGMQQLKGHRSVGGMRASIYNAMPIEGVHTLVDYMRDFERRHG